MSSAITNAGEALIALHQNQETGLVIDKFIIANVAGVDPAAAVDRAEGKPAAEDILLEYIIPAENKGYINPNQVVFSMLLGSDIGDFYFNWLGLYSSADDTVVAITYCPTLSKWKTAHPTMGNAITRNFMLEYSSIQDVTQIDVSADTWQIDFTARLKGIDERERMSNKDIYGEACFFGDGYLVINDADTFKLQPGTGYVEGIRIDQVAEQIINPGALPAEVFLDVALQPQGSDRVAIASVVFADPGDYADGTNDNHYGQKIADIDGDGVVTDFRPKSLGSAGEMMAEKDHTHDEYEPKTNTDTIYIGCGAMTSSMTDGATSEVVEDTANGLSRSVASFPGTDKNTSMEFEFLMPGNWDADTITAKLVWSAPVAVAGDEVRFDLAAVAIGDGEALDTPLGAAVAIDDTVTAAGMKQKSTSSADLTVGGIPSAGDLVRFKLTRDFDYGTQPLADVAQGLGLLITYGKV